MSGHVESPLVRRIRESIIGDDELMPGPYGQRRLTYADHTASGRALSFVEDYIRTDVLPWYANTHTESSATGRRTTQLRERARRVIRDAVGGDEDTIVIFTGSGSTAAVDKLVRLFGLLPHPGCPGRTDQVRPVVFVGPYEHHSNELLWRESTAEVVRIEATASGAIDTDHLERELRRHNGRTRLIGSFSAGSNVTGVRADVPAITAQLHRHGAMACWDFAAAGAHVEIDMCADRLDAIFLSPHKLPGGPGTPGVLVVRRELVRNPVPTVPGGGTISYVHPGGQFYLDDPVQREEGGTPGIVESIRAGIVFGLKRAVGATEVAERESELVRRAITSWQANAAIDILGDPAVDRLPIVSFVLRPPGRRPLHHNFVVAVLSDLFGIQCRGGCSCAGPYGHRLLRIGDADAHALAEQTVNGWLGIKPGWARVSFAFYMSDAVANYIIEAVHLVACYGERLLPDYRFEPTSGLWSHRTFHPAGPSRRLDSFDPDELPGRPGRAPESVLGGHLDEARALFRSRPEAQPDRYPYQTMLVDDVERLRWFQLPPNCLHASTAPNSTAPNSTAS